MGQARVSNPMPFFKETESNPNCCGCNKPQARVNPLDAITQSQVSIQDYGTHVVENRSKSRTQLFDHPKQIGDSYYTHPQNIVQQFETPLPNYKIPQAN
jgi:hypothetical protein